MARTVGDAAGEQVADFLALCGTGIEAHFSNLGNAKVANKSRTCNRCPRLALGATVNVSSVPGGSFECGLLVTAPPEVQIPMDINARGVVVLWIYSKGRRRGEDTVWEISGGWPHSRGGDWYFNDRGAVVLACIPIKPHPPESFDVDRDPLVAEVTQTFARITAEQTQAIASFVAGLKKSDEG